MATVTGTNLLTEVLADTGVTMNPSVQLIVAARLQAMIDAGFDTGLNIALVLSAASSDIKAAVPVLTDLGTIVETAKTDIEAGTGGVTGETVTLTTDADVVGPDADAPLKTTADNDTITGVVSALTSENTLNTTDQIDGGAGNDTLALSVNGNFTGFTGDGKLEGVETVQLNSASTVDRTFTAKGVTGVERWEIDATKGAVNLAGLELGATVALANQAQGNFAIAYATDVTKGTDDTQSIELSSVGTAKVGTTAAKAVTISVTGVETINMDVTGTNVANMTAAATKTLVVTGDGSLEMATVAAGLKTLDASAVTGNMVVDLDAAADVTSVKFGAGNDKLTVLAGDDVTANATLAGGAGNDTLVIKSGAAATVQSAQTGFETIQVGAQSGVVTYSGTNATDINKLVATGGAVATALNQDIKFVNMGAGALDVNVQGANANVKTLSSDHSGATSLTVDTPATTATTTAPSVNAIGVSLSKSASVDMTVASKMDYQGVVTASEASSVTVAIAGQTSSGAAEIAAAKAGSVVVSSVAADSVLKISANKATDLSVTAAKDLDITGSALAGVQSLTVAAGTLFDATGVALSALNIANLSGAGEIVLGALGDAAMDYGMTVNASNVGDLTVGTLTTKDQSITFNAASVVGDVTVGGAINAGAGNVIVDVSETGGNVALGAITGKSVTIDAANALGTMAYNGAINVGSTLSINAANLTDNDFATNKIIATGTSLTATLNSGLGDDDFEIDAAAGGTKITVSGNLGLGTNSVDINGGAGADEINASGLVLNSLDTTVGVTIDASGTGNDKVTGSAGNDTITVTAGDNTITGGKGADDITLGGGTDTVVIAQGDTGITAATIDSITAFTSGTDKLKLGTAATVTNYVELADADYALDFAVTKAAADVALDGTVKYVFVGDTDLGNAGAGLTGFLFIDYDMDGTSDAAVELVGLQAATFAMGDIIA